jgi:hypothetical protein
MALQDVNECAVRGCGRPCYDEANLCRCHFVPGVVVVVGHGTCVVSAWYTERAKLSGLVVMNDFALGDLFGGASGFKAKLEQQGFAGVRILHTPEELKAARVRIASTPGGWSGPWQIEYPWESGRQ